MKNKVFLIILFFNLFSCQDNVLITSSTVEKNDEYYYNQAMDQLNDLQFDQTISTITLQLSPSYQVLPKTRELLSSAYAGKCGLNFIDYTYDLSQQTTGGIFQILMNPFVQKTIAPVECVQSLAIMNQIGTSAQRTVNQNLFTAVVGMVLSGSSLRSNADFAPALGDGSKDIDVCVGLSDAQIDEVILGFGHMVDNFTYLESSLIGGYSLNGISEVVDMCTLLSGGSCAITQSSQITPVMRAFMRDLLNTSDYGIGAVSTGGDPLLVQSACP